MKKIVISSNTSWSIFNFRLELVRFLAKSYQVEIIAPKDQYSDKLRELGFVVHDINMAPSSIAPLQDIATLLAYCKLLKKIKPDYYLGFTAKPNIYGGFIAGLLGCKVINNIAGLGRTFSSSGLLQSLMQLLYRVGLRHSKHVFFQNRDDQILFVENGLLKKATHSVLPGSGVNTKRFTCKVDKLVDHSSADSTQFVFLFSARLLLEKGIREYISAASQLKTIYPHCTFQVLGKHSGSAAELPKAELDEAYQNGTIKYLGTTDNVVAVLHNADFFVLPSYYREGVPRSLLEAGSCGLPLITTDSVGCRETVIHGQNGYLIAPRDSHALFIAMKSMVELSIEQRNSMGLASRDYMVNNFSESLVLQQYQQVLSEQ
ncbi:glycosyltransferase family 4 protein [Shewanella oncorhynchi]|uniref:Glycosyltransferase family 4 protein n=1 Tax=Shewanella oncorhynchi TaxID=2726434 RepID=A0AA50KFW0_9GAMM|nr:glycosyltransferase family 4 protein [Shewanella oncorhynchi]WMB74459.1 glycosyltransferase family 4 protein [Shewanella oncorhynchi]